MKFRPLILVAALLLSACSQEAPPPVQAEAPQVSALAPAADDTAPMDPEALYAAAAQALFSARPVNATALGLPEAVVGQPYNQRLDDYSPAVEAAMRGRLREIARQLENASVAGADDAERLNRAIMANVSRYFAGNEQFPVGYIDTWMGLSPFIVNQINGPLMDVPRNLVDGHQVNSRQDAEDYLARLAALDTLVNSVITRMESDAQNGWVPPKVLLQGAMDYMARFTQAPAAEHSLVSSFAEKLDAVEELRADERDAMVAQASRSVEEVVYPSYRLAMAAVNQMLPKGRTESGIWAQPAGDIFYQDAIRFLGDSDLGPAEIHQVGLDEIERIDAEMDAILRAEGYTEGSVGQRMVALSEEDRFLYEDSPEGRAQLLADLNGQIAEITERMRPIFKTAPPYDVEVRAYPEEIQDGMAGGSYQSPPVDGSKPGIYWINLRDMKAVPSFALKTLTYHEANPGHHWQVSLNLAQDDFPVLRRLSPYNAYAEGWALYSELVAYELGMYDGDPFGNLGRLQDEMFRAVRLAVDTGLHHKRWTREQAVAFMMEKTGKVESEVVPEIERYMTWPGQALGYKLGMLKIQALRAKAEEALGEQFNLAEFHDLLLLGGAMPMALLEARVDGWIEDIQNGV